MLEKFYLIRGLKPPNKMPEEFYLMKKMKLATELLDQLYLNFIIILKPCNLYLLYAYVPTKLHLNLLY